MALTRRLGRLLSLSRFIFNKKHVYSYQNCRPDDVIDKSVVFFIIFSSKTTLLSYITIFWRNIPHRAITISSTFAYIYTVRLDYHGESVSTQGGSPRGGATLNPPPLCSNKFNGEN